jgi:hypothetical protein
LKFLKFLNVGPKFSVLWGLECKVPNSFSSIAS